ncbi:MAG: VanW family protein, partial [Eubacteriales bacterium]|nr:VanW family protein [Eubacteriales bacterium]
MAANNYNGYSRKSVSRKKSRKRRKQHDYTMIYIGLGVIVVLLVILGIITFKGKGKSTDTQGSSDDTAIEETTEALNATDEIRHNAVIDLSAIIGSKSGIADDNKINVRGMTPAEISEAISEKYSWSMAIVNSDANVGDVVKPQADINQTTEAATLGDAENPDSGSGEDTYSEISVSDKISVPDYIAERIPAFIDLIVNADADYIANQPETTTAAETEKAKKSRKSAETESETSAEETTDPEPEVVYTFTLDDLDAEIDEIVSYAANMWYVEPLGGSIGSYDSANDKFVMENSRSGFKIDKDTLKSGIQSAIGSKGFDEQIKATGTVLSAEDSSNVSGAYTTIATFTTNTTSNSVRNKNIQLACNKLNGTIVRPGEEFSFNNTVGQRTKEAGFGEAAAYNNGEVVQEVGGGVCQVSTTLYNAVVKAGLKVTARQSHTFKPTYVTPGQDATVSWGGPDFRFANLPSKSDYSYNSSYAIGIRASYYNQTVTVSIYGRPVLKDGYSFSLDSKQTQTIEMVRQLITPGSGKTPEKGSEGSVWETRLIIKKDGEVVSNNVDHNAYYSGHIEYYTDETAAPVTESQSESETVPGITDDPSQLQPAGPGGSTGPGVIGPGGSTGPGG